MADLESIIETAWDGRDKITPKTKGEVRKAVDRVLSLLDQGKARVAEKKDVVVRLCDEGGHTVLSWSISNAFPTQLDAPTFSATSNDAAIETMTLMADGVTISEP